MNSRLSRYATVAGLVIVLSIFMIALSCGKGDNVSLENGQLKGQGTVPLVPIDLPMYPTDVTLEGMADAVRSKVNGLLDDYDLGWVLDAPSAGAINGVFDDIEASLQDASMEILQPGVLSVSVDNQVTDTLRDYLKVTSVGVNYKITNNTDSFVRVPVEYQLFLGDGAKAEAWDPSVMIPFESDRVDADGKFIVDPGETLDLSIENVPQLVDALNNSATIGVGYKSIYRVGEIVDDDLAVKQFLDKFLVCILKKVSGFGSLLDFLPDEYGDCPTAQELIAWHLTINKFELVIQAESQFDIPPIPYCSELADEMSSVYDTSLLKEACPPENGTQN